MKIDRQLYEQFDEFFGHNQHIISILFKGNKNLYNIICSAKDWIRTVIDGIDTETLIWENSNQASIRLITFISCVDILWKGIQQLERAIISSNSIPFKGDKSIFNQEDADDNTHFKRIRAIFAAHSVNLNEVYSDDKKEGRKWYASWSYTGMASDRDFSVWLYCNAPDVPSRQFSIGIKEVFQFALKRYDHLNALMKAIEERIVKYKEEHCYEKISLDGLDPAAQVNLLLEENKKRWNSDYIGQMLRVAREVFETEPGSEMNRYALEQYRDALKPEIEQIYKALQNMDMEAEIEEIPEVYPREIDYAMEKLFSSNDPMFDWGMQEAQKYLNGVVDLYKQNKRKEIQAVARAGLWLKKKNS